MDGLPCILKCLAQLTDVMQSHFKCSDMLSHLVANDGLAYVTFLCGGIVIY